MKTTLMALLTGVLLSGAAANPPADGSPKSDLFKVTTSYGDTYHNCKVLKLTPEAVTLMHEQGVTKIGLELLPPELQKKFDYQPEKAREYALAEQVKKEKAEAAAAVLKEKRDRAAEEQMAALAAAEKARAEAAANLPLPPSVARQGNFDLPTNAPIHEVYTPGGDRRYGSSYRDGYYYPWTGNYSTYYYQPQVHTYPVIVRPPVIRPTPRPQPRTHIRGSVGVDSGVIRINR
jgi:hypothetical protein